MSRRKFRLTASKNWKRRKYAKPESLVVSIPLSVKAPTVIDDPCKLALPPRWSFATTESDSEIRVCKIEASLSGPELSLLPNPIQHTDDLASIIHCVDSCTLCIGNNDEAFTPLVERHKGDFRDPRGNCTCYRISLSLSLV